MIDRPLAPPPPAIINLFKTIVTTTTEIDVRRIECSHFPNIQFYQGDYELLCKLSWKLEEKSIFGIQEVLVGVERWEMSALAADPIPCSVPITSGTCDLGGG